MSLMCDCHVFINERILTHLTIALLSPALWAYPLPVPAWSGFLSVQLLNKINFSLSVLDLTTF